MAKLPYMQFFVDDWLSDEKLRLCSSAARGLWIDVLCLMWKNDQRGYLQVGGKPVTSLQLARMSGRTEDEVSAQLQELVDAGVPSLAANGCLFSRRMIREQRLSEVRAKAGSQGGNPRFKGSYATPGYVYAMRRHNGNIKIGISKNPKSRKTNIAVSQGMIDLLRMWPVNNMGAAESLLHEKFKDRCVGGEWFTLTDADLDSIDSFLLVQNQSNHLANGSAKVEQIPGSGIGSGIEPLKKGKRGPGGKENQSFEQFWAVYPRHEKRKHALKLWEQINPDEGLLKQILAAVEKAKKSAQWRDPQYIPLPTTWLNAAQWDDEPLPPAAPTVKIVPNFMKPPADPRTPEQKAADLAADRKRVEADKAQAASAAELLAKLRGIGTIPEENP